MQQATRLAALSGQQRAALTATQDMLDFEQRSNGVKFHSLFVLSKNVTLHLGSSTPRKSRTDEDDFFDYIIGSNCDY